MTCYINVHFKAVTEAMTFDYRGQIFMQITVQMSCDVVGCHSM